MSSITTESLFDKLPPESVVFGRSEAMRVIREKLDKIAATNLPVLVQGENGTGKETIARMIHERSPWSLGPFVKLNCPTLPAALLSNQLFASNPSAPSQDVECGTVLLDEICELDAALQLRLAVVLQDSPFCRITLPSGKFMQARVICSSSRDVQAAANSGVLRRELFYRINVIQLQLPALRQRSEDIPLIVDYLLEQHNEKYAGQARAISPRLLEMLQEYDWPGNLRELDNLLKRYVILGSEDVITAELTNAARVPSAAVIPIDGNTSLKKLTRQAVRDLERQIILRSLQANNWNRKRVARALSISYRALLYKIRDAGLSSSRAEKRAAAAGQSNDRAA